jgi:D-serine deaminase-like pyridoxal phosphate-dependent protein
MKMELASELAANDYSVETKGMLTPALMIYEDRVRQNIDCMLKVLEGKPERWRPHLKTVKLGAITKLLVDAGITTAKCATTLELRMACQAGMRDVLVAYPHTGKNTQRIAEIAKEFSKVRISAIVESEQQLPQWKGAPVGLFIDINAGMDRTGVERSHRDEILALAKAIRSAGIEFRGLHFYDGNSTEPDLQQRTQKAHQRYGDLLAAVKFLEASDVKVPEVITAGTPALPCVLSYPDLWNSTFTHCVSPGTVVYCDASSVDQLPTEYGFTPAVAVVSRVVSHPKPGIATCDAGHKSVSVDSGVPNCVVIGHPEMKATKPSEEHLPFEIQELRSGPALGAELYLIPRHVCPTVNNFDRAAIVRSGKVIGIEPVTARGREGPLSN